MGVRLPTTIRPSRSFLHQSHPKSSATGPVRTCCTCTSASHRFRPKNQESRLQMFCLVPSAHGYMSHASIGLVRKTWSLASKRFCPVPSAHGYMSHASIGFVRKTWSLASKMFCSVPSVHVYMSHASIGLVRKTRSFASIIFCKESPLRWSIQICERSLSSSDIPGANHHSTRSVVVCLTFVFRHCS